MPTDSSTTWLDGLSRAVDAVIEAIAPRHALARERVRHARKMQDRAHALLERYYDGANNSDRLRGDRWLASRLSPDSALEMDLAELREHAKELYRNFGLVTGAIDHRTDNVVGAGLHPKARIRPVDGIITDDQAKRWNDEINELYQRWEPHAGGPHESFASQLRLAHRTWRMMGDCLIVRSDIGLSEKPIPLSIDVITPERIATPNEKAADPRVRLGIERDKYGFPVRYWIRETHPDDSLDNRETYRAFDRERVSHLMERLFPEQSRGIPWCFSITNDCRDVKDYREAVIIAAQVAACQTAIVQTQNPELLSANGLNSAGQLELAPGKVLYTALGDSVSAFNPTQPQTTYAMFNEQNQLGIAAGLNYPFGWLVKDRRRATFSAGRLEEIDGSIPLRADYTILRDRVISPTWRRLIVEGIIVGELSIPPTLFNRLPHLFTRYSLTPNGRPWVDPQKEVVAAILAKEHNIGTLTAILSKLGMDIDEVLETRSEERQRETDLGITPPIYTGSLPTDTDPDDVDGDSDPDNTDDDEAGSKNAREEVIVA